MSGEVSIPAKATVYTYDTFAGNRLKWIFVLPVVYVVATASRAIIQVDDWTSPFARNVVLANVLVPVAIAVVTWLVGFYYIRRRVTADERGLAFKPDPNSLWFWTAVVVPWPEIDELALTSRRAYDIFGAPSFRLEAAVTANCQGKPRVLPLPPKLPLLNQVIGRAGLAPTATGQPAQASELWLNIEPVIGAKRVGWRWARRRDS